MKDLGGAWAVEKELPEKTTLVNSTRKRVYLGVALRPDGPESSGERIPTEPDIVRTRGQAQSLKQMLPVYLSTRTWGFGGACVAPDASQGGIDRQRYFFLGEMKVTAVIRFMSHGLSQESPLHL